MPATQIDGCPISRAFFAREVGVLHSRSGKPTKSSLSHHRFVPTPSSRIFPMPWGLKRYYGTGGLHFITWSCYRRLPLLADPAGDLLLSVLEVMRKRYQFVVIGYVVMPEHIHLLISEPQIGNPSTVVQAVKLGFSRRWTGMTGFSGQFWQRRFYDFNLWSQRKEVEKLKYMHRNPVVRGLAADPADWPWSSYRFYAYGEAGPVRINDWTWWEEKLRISAG